MGLLGSSVTLTILRSFTGVKSVGYSHRASTRQKARELGVADFIADTLEECVAQADIVILATPICTFEFLFKEIAGKMKEGCIVTDVGSTKVLPCRWGEKYLGKKVRYVGSHPIAGSEKRGVEFARDDLFVGSKCIVTPKSGTDNEAFETIKDMWSKIGCSISVMSPAEHDRIFGRVSHLPHVTAAALVNASDGEQLKFAGKGFIDTSRVASGPANVWSDILMTNSANIARGIGKLVEELQKLQKAIESKDQNKIEKLLEQARSKREDLINYKFKQKELL